MTINWEHYKTQFDNIAKREKNYQRGLKTGQGAVEFHIAVNGVWSTRNKPTSLSSSGSSTFSYEMLGYHANTAYFLRGILDSGVEIVDHRESGIKNKFDALPIATA